MREQLTQRETQGNVFFNSLGKCIFHITVSSIDFLDVIVTSMSFTFQTCFLLNGLMQLIPDTIMYGV